MKKVILLLVLLSFIGTSFASYPTRVKKLDRPYWDEFKAWGATLVPDTIYQYGRAEYDHQVFEYGKWVTYFRQPVDTVWYKIQPWDYKHNSRKETVINMSGTVPETKEIILKPIKLPKLPDGWVRIGRKVETRIPQCRCTVSYFYDVYLPKYAVPRN